MSRRRKKRNRRRSPAGRQGQYVPETKPEATDSKEFVMSNKAVFLDRDGTIIRDTGYLSSPEEIKLLPGADMAIKSIRQAGFKVIVVTNQSGVARGMFTLERMQEINEALRQQLADRGARLDGVYACPFHPEGKVAEYAKDSDLRKPQPGMLLQAAEDLDIDLEASWMVGDSGRDIEAGIRAGCRTVWVHQRPQDEGGRVQAEFTARNLVDAARVILRESAAPGAGDEESSAAQGAQAPAGRGVVSAALSRASAEGQDVRQPPRAGESSGGTPHLDLPPDDPPPGDDDADEATDTPDPSDTTDKPVATAAPAATPPPERSASSAGTAPASEPPAPGRPPQPSVSHSTVPQSPASQRGASQGAAPSGGNASGGARRPVSRWPSSVQSAGDAASADAPQAEPFSVARMVAGTVQMLAVLALLIVAWRSAFDAEVMGTLVWAVVAVALQAMSLTFYVMQRVR